MKNIDRENYKKIYIEEVYKKSWTYAKLTEEEQQKIIDILYSAKLYGNNKEQLTNEMHSIYSAFLSALDYDPIHWRETEEEKQFICNF